MVNILIGVLIGIAIDIFCRYLVTQNASVKGWLATRQISRYEKFWIGDVTANYKKDHDAFLAMVKTKKLDYLKNCLKSACLKCRMFDEELPKSANVYFCCVEGSCPGVDLRPLEKRRLIDKLEKVGNVTYLNSDVGRIEIEREIK